MTEEIKQRIEQIKRGQVPHGYKRTKVGIVPNDWETPKANLLFKNVSDKNHNGELEVLSATQDKGVIPRSEVNIDIKYDVGSLNNFKKVCKGDFVISLRSFQGGIEYSEYEGIISPAYTILKEKQEISRLFYKSYLKSPDYIQRLNVAVYGIRDGKQISYENFGFIELPNPSLSEQQKIAEILTIQDKVIELKEKLLAEKQQQKKWLMQNLLTGKKRLSGFTGEWEKVKLNEVLVETKKRNVNQDLLICSVAIQKGVISQIKHLGRKYASANTSNYNVVSYGDIIYTKSPTGEFPYGIIKQSHLKGEVAVSPLYGVYKPVNYSLGYILHCYFQYPVNANNYLIPIVQKGAKNTINISNQTFISNLLLIPVDKKEQTAIAGILSIADREIELMKKNIEAEKQKKKALMQLLLTGIVRVNV